jgi:hypothetical protein
VSRSLPLRQPIGRQDGGSVPLRQPIGTQDGGGSGKSVYVEWPRFKASLPSRCRGGGGGGCIKHFFTVYKLLRL